MDGGTGMLRKYRTLVAGLLVGALGCAPAGAERSVVVQHAPTPTYDEFIDAIRVFSNDMTVELPGAGAAPLSDRIVAGFGQDPVRRLRLDEGTTLYWGWQHRQAFIRSLVVTGPDGQIRLVAAAKDLPRVLNLRSGRAIATPEEYAAYMQKKVEDGHAPSLVLVARSQAALEAYYPLVLRWVQASALGFNADCSDRAQARTCAFVETLEVPAVALAIDCGSGRANDCPLGLPERTAINVPLEAFRQ